LAINAYILISAEAGKIKETADAVSKIEGVKIAHPCWGQPDVIAFIEASDQNALSELVLSKIQGVDGVTSTSTHIVVQF